MEKVVVFVDYANISRAASDGGVPLDMNNLLTYLVADRFLIEAFVYVPIDPRDPTGRDRTVEDLWISGYFVVTKRGQIAGQSYKCDFDVEMTIDILRVAHDIKPDIIVLASGDSDFAPVIEYVRKNGIRVEGASFSASASREVIMKSSGFIKLDDALLPVENLDAPVPPTTDDQ